MLLAVVLLLLRVCTEKNILYDLLWDEPVGVNPSNDTIEELLVVWELMQLVPRASQHSATM